MDCNSKIVEGVCKGLSGCLDECRMSSDLSAFTCRSRVSQNTLSIINFIHTLLQTPFIQSN